MCRLCLVVTADETLAKETRLLTLPNAWVAVVCAPESLAGLLDSFQFRHILLDARSVRGREVQGVLAAKARSVPVSRSSRNDRALALLSSICREPAPAAPPPTVAAGP
jgi:hypothetical protein